jgi:hypothetical protein
MQVKLNKADLIAVDTMLTGVKSAYPRVVYRSINSTLGTSKTYASKEIGLVLNLTATRIKKDFKMYKAGPSNLKGSLVAKGKPINLATFKGTRQTQKGISVQVLVGSPRKIIKHAFIWKRTTKAGSEAKTAFWRKEIMKRPYDKTIPYGFLAKTGIIKSLPVETLSGPRIEDIYSRSMLLDKVLKNAGDKYAENIDRNLTYELSKL